MKLLVAIPAYNEEGTISDVIQDVQRHLLMADILVINDGSTDNTKIVTQELGISTLHFPFNMGVGAAMTGPRGRRSYPDAAAGRLASHRQNTVGSRAPTHLGGPG